MGAERQRFDTLRHPHPPRRLALPPPLDLLHLRLPRALRAALARLRRPLRDRQGRTAGGGAPNGDGAIAVETDRGIDLRAARRRRARLAPGAGQRRRLPAARRAALARARGAPATAPPRTSRSGSTAATSRPATAGASRPARSCGSGSAPSTPRSTSARRPSCWPRTSDATGSATRATGSPTSCARRPRRGVFFVGDSAGHCLPLTAEGIRTALYFGMALGRELRGGRRGAPEPRGGGGDATPSSTTRTSGSSAGCCGCRSSCRGSRRGCSGR